MPQHLKTAVAAEKRWGWHLVLFKDWLRAVQGGLTARRYTKWLRTRKVFDRELVEFSQRLLGIAAARGQAPRLTEVGLELIEELERSEREQVARQSESPEEGGRDAPTSGARVRRRRDDSALEAQNPELRQAPSANDDPFLRALLERFAELNPYLTRFTLAQIGEDFLSESELFRRIASADYEALCPSMPLFQGWLNWLDWLGGIGKVGFRYQVTQAGGELYSYLQGIPLEELLADDPLGEEEPEGVEGAAPAVGVPSSEDEGAALAPRAAELTLGSEEADGLEEEGFESGDLEEDDFEAEGLDLPPEAEADPDVVPYWQRPPEQEAAPIAAAPAATTAAAAAALAVEESAPGPEAPAEPPEPSVSISSSALDRLFGGDVSAPPPPSSKPAPQPAPKPAPAESATTGATPARARAQARPRAVARAKGAAGSQSASRRVVPIPSPVPSPGLAAATPAASPAPTAAAAPGSSAPAPSPAPGRPPVTFGRTGSFGRLLTASGALGRLPDPATTAGVQLNRAALGLATEWWLAGPSPRPASGVELSPDPSGQPVAAFRLLALASLLEAEAPSAEARRLHAALIEAGALRALLVEEAPLERALEVAWGIGAPALLEERLVHLLRFRRGLLRLGDLGLRAGSARELGRTLRDQVTGPTLGPGLLLVVAELCQAGYAPAADLSELAWLPDLSDLAPPSSAPPLESP